MSGAGVLRRLSPAAAAVAAAAVTLAGLLAGCATRAPTVSGPAAQPSGNTKIAVVAAENFWGSIAAQVGGEHVTVHSIIASPDTDPHDYEPTPADGRALATAQYVIANGVGYDPWVAKLVNANPAPARSVLTVGELVGVKEGGNPHRWYSPDDVHRVVEQIAADYERIDPTDAGYFDQRKQTYETHGLAGYDQLIADIKSKYGATPIGASESIVTPLVEGLGLRLATPESFLDAVSEGTDPTAADKITVDQQIKTKQIKIFVFNRQNSTPDVAALVTAAKDHGIPVATVTETLVPATASFQDWQVGQLRGIEQALSQASAR
ncbi:MAG: zinc ABC transporter substrate-binding protein [Actinomycetota bacterium]|nr:zinc ABC transporter substrate-binding protein [Actinomycetota bacterium]